MAFALAACGPSAVQQPAAPTGPAAQQSVAPAKPAEPAKPASQPAKPAAEPAKPADQPAKPAEPAKPAAQPAAAAKPAESAPARKIVIGGTSSTSTQFAYYAAVSKVINAKVPNVSSTLVETGGGIENTTRMSRGEFDMGVTSSDVYYLAYSGLDRWKDKPIPELRWLWLYLVNPVAVAVREDSGVRKLEDLEGKDFQASQRGAAAEQAIKNMFEVLGIKPKWYVGSYADSLQATKDRHIVGYGKPMAGKDAPDASMLDLMTATKIRVVGFTEEQSKKIQTAYPYYAFGSISARAFKDQEWNREPIRTWVVVVGTGATTRLPEDVAYQTVKAIVEDNSSGGEGVQSAALPALKGENLAKLTVEQDLLDTPPLHAGAYRYFRELGLKVPDKLIPAEAKR